MTSCRQFVPPHLSSADYGYGIKRYRLTSFSFAVFDLLMYVFKENFSSSSWPDFSLMTCMPFSRAWLAASDSRETEPLPGSSRSVCLALCLLSPRP